MNSLLNSARASAENWRNFHEDGRPITPSTKRRDEKLDLSEGEEKLNEEDEEDHVLLGNDVILRENSIYLMELFVLKEISNESENGSTPNTPHSEDGAFYNHFLDRYPR
jgi:hypothetical protein